jgi:uncharacterized protein (TIGR02117 family)
LLLVGLELGCVSGVKGLYPPPAGQSAETVYVLHRGLHTGIIIRAADVPAGLWPEHREFPQAEYLEAGWGDSEGYRYPLTTQIALRAMFDSKGSVVLIHAFSGSITHEYAGVAKEIVAVQLSQAGFVRLCKYVQDTYALERQGGPIPLPSVYPDESFFLATGHYSIFNNCNNWTARALRTAGCPIRPSGCLVPGVVTRETRRFGVVIWQHGRAVSADGVREWCYK